MSTTTGLSKINIVTNSEYEANAPYPDGELTMTPISGMLPVGAIMHFSSATVPAGFLVCDGGAIGRETYPELFATIGTTYGAGDGSTTFNLPNLIDRFVQGAATAGTVKAAGLPDITGQFPGNECGTDARVIGAFSQSASNTKGSNDSDNDNGIIDFKASRSNAIYGASTTVQPPAVTMLPCIKAFDSYTNPGLIDITELANDLSGKLDKVVNGVDVKYITETYNDGTNWYRKYSDGWVEQGGNIAVASFGSYVRPSRYSTQTFTFLVPFSSTDFDMKFTIKRTDTSTQTCAVSQLLKSVTSSSAEVEFISEQDGGSSHSVGGRWYACGMGA